MTGVSDRYQEVMEAMALARGTIGETCDTIRQGLDAGDDPVVFLANMATSFSGTPVFKEGGSGAGLYVMAAFLLLEMQDQMESWKATCEVLEDPDAMADLAVAAAEHPDDMVDAMEMQDILLKRLAAMGDELEGAQSEAATLRSMLDMVNGAYVSLRNRKNAEVEELLIAVTLAEGKVAELTRALAEAEAVIILASHELGVDHPVWMTLDDYDGSMDSVRRVKQLCDDGVLGFPFTQTRGGQL